MICIRVQDIDLIKGGSYISQPVQKLTEAMEVQDDIY